MSTSRVGAVGVVDGETLVGIFTERDLMERVVLNARDPTTTAIADVMTAPVESVHPNDDPW